MKHFTEDDLIAYHLQENKDAEAIRTHLESCQDCAAISDSIAHTLRVFSAEPAPQPNMEHNWQRLRGNLSVLPQAQRSRWKLLMLPAFGLVAAALLVAVFVGLHLHREHTRYAFDRKGPLTVEPAEELNHLDTAERLLTEVNHTSGALDESTLATAHTLQLHNALYVQKARQRGDLAEASTLENLGRVLTSIGNEPRSSEGTFRVRFEMNTDGLLLDIRILRQNDTR
jgi:hypothetical protein